MLCQFSVKNYKSIRDEITFDMQAAAISEHTDRVIKDSDEQLFLPVSALYGPNGGGKSNVLEALQALGTMVLRPVHATKQNRAADYKFNRYPVKPFVFSEEGKNNPTEFEIFFRTKIAEYRYVLRIKENIIVYESLDRVKLETGRKSALFLRKGEEISLRGIFARLKISDGLSQSLPLLSYLGITYMNNDVVKDVIDWFEYGIDLIEVFTQHNVDGYKAELTLSEESSGTKKLFGLLPFIAKSLASGSTLVIDELDAKIHPVLLRYVIMLFNNMEINRHGAQLVFTSHDLSTMNSEVFRRDEIWFVAKGNNQNSKLYSLVEFKTGNGEVVRKDAKYDKQYLEGKYGADPYLRKIIDWSVVNA